MKVTDLIIMLVFVSAFVVSTQGHSDLLLWKSAQNQTKISQSVSQWERLWKMFIN